MPEKISFEFIAHNFWILSFLFLHPHHTIIFLFTYRFILHSARANKKFTLTSCEIELRPNSYRSSSWRETKLNKIYCMWVNEPSDNLEIFSCFKKFLPPSLISWLARSDFVAITKQKLFLLIWDKKLR